MQSWKETESFVWMFADAVRNPRLVAAVLGVTGTGLLACAPPAAAPLGGAPVPAVAIPSTEFVAGHRLIAFRWEYVEGSSLTRGEGAVRVAPPDSARLDLFLGGFGSGAALLIGDELYAPLPDAARNIIPPPPMLWAAFGRFAVPGARDTVVRADGDLIRADIGTGPVWRATFTGNGLTRLEHIAEGRIREYVERDDTRVRYVSNVAQRRLTLTIIRDESVPPFDRSVWTL
jgi:hypothetical protein